MRKALTVAAILLLAAPAAAQDIRQDVIRMAQAGVSDDVILSFLRARNVRVELTSEDIVALKQAGVSDGVVQALISPPAQVPAPQPTYAAPSAPPPPQRTNVVHYYEPAPAVYYYDPYYYDPYPVYHVGYRPYYYYPRSHFSFGFGFGRGCW